MLVKVLTDILRALHPFMPFITEEIYQHLPGHSKTIMLDPWPAENRYWPEAVKNMQQIMQVIRSIRNIRAEFTVNPGTPLEAILVVADDDLRNMLQDNSSLITEMANLSQVQIVAQLEHKPKQAAASVLAGTEVYVPLGGAIDVDKEIQRLQKEARAAEAEMEKAEAKLNNPGVYDQGAAAGSCQGTGKTTGSPYQERGDFRTSAGIEGLIREKLNGLCRLGIKPGLERITALLEALGNPHKHLRAVHVAGH